MQLKQKVSQFFFKAAKQYLSLLSESNSYRINIEFLGSRQGSYWKKNVTICFASYKILVWLPGDVNQLS